MSDAGSTVAGVRERVSFACSACGQLVAQWAGRCPGCEAWGTVQGSAARPVGVEPAARPVPLGTSADEERIPTGVPGLDRVLGGGLVPGSVVLLAGPPGIGKSTLVLQMLGS